MGLDRLIHIYRVILIINCCGELSPFLLRVKITHNAMFSPWLNNANKGFLYFPNCKLKFQWFKHKHNDFWQHFIVEWFSYIYRTKIFVLTPTRCHFHSLYPRFLAKSSAFALSIGPLTTALQLQAFWSSGEELYQHQAKMITFSTASYCLSL